MFLKPSKKMCETNIRILAVTGFLAILEIVLALLAGFITYGQADSSAVFKVFTDAGMRSVWLGANALVGAGALLVFTERYKRHQDIKISDTITKGSSGWASDAEIKSKLDFGWSSAGIVLGRRGNSPVVYPAAAWENRNVAVLGPPDTGKSRAYVRPNLFHAVNSEMSVICTDPKGELTRDFRKYLEKKGYIVRVFNLVNFVHGDRWNPLAEVRDDVDAQMMCDVIISSTSVPGRKSGDQFWERTEMNLLKALILYVVNEYPLEKRTMASVYDILASGDVKIIDGLFNPLSNSHPAKLAYNIFRQSEPKVQSGAISGLGTRLQVFQNKIVRDFTEHSDISLTMPGNRKCAYFCVLSDTDSTFYFLSSLFFSFLFIKLTRLADLTPGGVLKVPVSFILDEFCNIGHIPDFTKKLSTMRSRGIGCSIIFQSLPQLMQFYSDKAWETILANCSTFLVMGVKDETTAKYIADYAGKITIKTVSRTKDAGFAKFLDFGKETVSDADRYLIMPDELFRMPKNEAIALISGIRPVKLEKLDFSRCPEYSKLEPEDLTDYMPKWVENESVVVEVHSEPKEIPQEIPEEKPPEKPKKKKDSKAFWK